MTDQNSTPADDDEVEFKDMSFPRKCIWSSCFFTIFSIITLSSILMSVGSSLLWSKLAPQSHYFELAESVNAVVCTSCIGYFTVGISFVSAYSIILVIGIACCIRYKWDMVVVGGILALSCVILLLVGLTLVITEPIWLSQSMNTLSNYEENSNITFQRQLLDEDVQIAWDIYQTKFHCCGIYSYKDYESLFLNSSIPTSCCNRTTLPEFFDCLDVVKHVTNKDVQSFNIYTDGCPEVIVSLLNLDSPSVYRIGVASLVFCLFIVFGCLLMLFLTFLLLARNKKECRTISCIMLCSLWIVCKLFIEIGETEDRD